MESTIYASVDEAIEDLRQVLPMLRVTKRIAQGHRTERDRHMYREACRLIEFLESGELRQRLMASRRADGSVEFKWAVT